MTKCVITYFLSILNHDCTILDDEVQTGESLGDLQRDVTSTSANIDNETVLWHRRPVEALAHCQANHGKSKGTRTYQSRLLEAGEAC